MKRGRSQCERSHAAPLPAQCEEHEAYQTTINIQFVAEKRRDGSCLLDTTRVQRGLVDCGVEHWRISVLVKTDRRGGLSERGLLLGRSISALKIVEKGFGTDGLELGGMILRTGSVLVL